MKNNTGYLFISNSSKLPKEKFESIEPIEISTFSEASIYAANQLGLNLHMGINRKYPEIIKSKDFNIKFYNQNSYRNIFALRDLWKAYKNLCVYLKKNPDIEIVHCNTPIGGLIGRLAGKKFKKKVIYTAHGFHFYEGAPIIQKLIFKNIERFLAKRTDVLITINDEDYNSALEFKLKKGGKLFKISGVGINLNKYHSVQVVNNLRENIGLSTNDFICISIGYLNKNKNFDTVIKAIADCDQNNIHYLICGEGELLESFKQLAIRLKIEHQIHFLGYRKDVIELLSISDCAIISSYREGLPRVTMEAMASGLPCIVSSIRGNRDLIEEGKGGFLINPNDTKGFANKIKILYNNRFLCKEMGEFNKEKIKEFDIEIVKSQMFDILSQI